MPDWSGLNGALLASREAEKRERALRLLRRTTVLLLRAAARCPDAEEAAMTRATAGELRAMADRWEAES